MHLSKKGCPHHGNLEKHPLFPGFPSGAYGGRTDVPDSLLIPQFPVLSALEVIATTQYIYVVGLY
ncbi:hypothetical protein [Paenibacillus polymyxa]|uniref:hypothetical protein n=1 Tax=Paenibacillus polymyxa TaxID=1406 RepID=UPI002ED4C45B